MTSTASPAPSTNSAEFKPKNKNSTRGVRPGASVSSSSSPALSGASLEEAERMFGRLTPPQKKVFDLVREVRADWNTSQVMEFLKKFNFEETTIIREVQATFEFDRPAHSQALEEWQTVAKPQPKKKEAPRPAGPAGPRPPPADKKPQANGVGDASPPSVRPRSSVGSVKRDGKGDAAKQAAKPAHAPKKDKEKEEAQKLPTPGVSYVAALKKKEEKQASPPPAAAPASAPSAAAAASTPSTTTAPTNNEQKQTESKVDAADKSKSAPTPRKPAEPAAAAAAASAKQVWKKPGANPAPATAAATPSPAAAAAPEKTAPVKSDSVAAPAKVESAAPVPAPTPASSTPTSTSTSTPASVPASVPAPVTAPVSAPVTTPVTVTPAPAAAPAPAPTPANPSLQAFATSTERVLLPTHLQNVASSESRIQFGSFGTGQSGPRAPAPKQAAPLAAVANTGAPTPVIQSAPTQPAQHTQPQALAQPVQVQPTNVQQSAFPPAGRFGSTPAPIGSALAGQPKQVPLHHEAQPAPEEQIIAGSNAVAHAYPTNNDFNDSTELNVQHEQTTSNFEDSQLHYANHSYDNMLSPPATYPEQSLDGAASGYYGGYDNNYNGFDFNSQYRQQQQKKGQQPGQQQAYNRAQGQQVFNQKSVGPAAPQQQKAPGQPKTSPQVGAPAPRNPQKPSAAPRGPVSSGPPVPGAFPGAAPAPVNYNAFGKPPAQQQPQQYPMQTPVQQQYPQAAYKQQQPQQQPQQQQQQFQPNKQPTQNNYKPQQRQQQPQAQYYNSYPQGYPQGQQAFGYGSYGAPSSMYGFPGGFPPGVGGFAQASNIYGAYQPNQFYGRPAATNNYGYGQLSPTFEYNQTDDYTKQYMHPTAASTQLPTVGNDGAPLLAPGSATGYPAAADAWNQADLNPKSTAPKTNTESNTTDLNGVRMPQYSGFSTGGVGAVGTHVNPSAAFQHQAHQSNQYPQYPSTWQ